MRKFLILASTAAFAITANVAIVEAATARTEASIECSKQADEKGLKGKARKKFRAKCKKSYKKAA
jgi:hypothetical protein